MSLRAVVELKPPVEKLYVVEFCGRGGNFGVAQLKAVSAEEAVRRVNASELVHWKERHLTRARLK